MRKGEIACNKQFLLFSQGFLPYIALFSLIYNFKMSSAICCNLDQSKILLSGNGSTQWINHKFLDWCKLKAFVDN